ncbi:flagellar biosynthesis protein FlgB [Kineosporia rhizophila]|uniref:flagellar basal body rod protein FlgB n=1 Tax=Kineosporia TaxID=49184 RepID=UPI000A59D568|nr:MULTISPECIES: flagellar biosynthesis protein FlgB [Kineosporia]MCE0534411.1 flagellar biosynthesis protein FlgB [Kineosporia rhizophila]GLY13945.1 flagellar basal body rod protein FlgB [Kineosporia sp. NBRC 101677]
MSMLDDVSIDALHSALDGLSMRQRAVSDDIANVNTPYYRARSVAFEDQLERALVNGDDPMESVTPKVVYSDAPGDLTGNNVDLGTATVNSVKTEMSYELALRATGDRFSLLRAAIRSN